MRNHQEKTRTDAELQPTRQTRNMGRVGMVGALALTLLALNACGGRATPASDLRIELRTAENIHTGAATLTIHVTNAAGQPVEDAAVTVEGNMTHAGMTPVLANGQGGPDGLYSVPFNWTMAGDWVVTVKVTLPDGRQAQADFPVGVTEP